MKLNRSEILRYMRMGRATPDAELSKRIDKVEAELLKVARPKEVHKLIKVKDLPFESADLKRVLGGAEECYLFAATLGHEVDLLIRRYSITSPADLLILQASAATMIEAYIDKCELELKKGVGVGVGCRELCTRFSPGYGDLPLSVQPIFLEMVDAGKQLGISLTDAYLMIPSKSVTAIIGVKK